MNALFNQRLVKKYCCARCFGPLVERFFVVDGEYQVICPRECKPGGFVTRAWADKQKAVSHAEAVEVEKNYPELSEKQPLTADERKRDRDALYGEGD